MAVCERPPGCSFPLSFPAQVVADNLIDHIKDRYQKMCIPGVTLHPTRLNKDNTWRASVEPALSHNNTELRKQRNLWLTPSHHGNGTTQTSSSSTTGQRTNISYIYSTRVVSLGQTTFLACSYLTIELHNIKN